MASHGRYNLLRKIADGGTAEVFLAHMEGSAGFKRLVVLKRVRPNLWADEAFRKGLLDEAHIMMGLHHSNIVQVLDLGVASKRYFLAFELVDGWTLSQVFVRAKSASMPMPLNLVLHVGAEICRALAYAHSRSANGVPLGIVHRDVSPQNVLLSEEGEVKLTDFGIAKARTRVTTSQIGSVKGKPAFMSPEQADGRELDARSDLFPIGTMLYQLVTGELPFLAQTPLEEMALVSAAKFLPPEKKRPDLPKELVALIHKALERKTEKRFQSAAEMLTAIEKVQRTALEPAGQTELKAWLGALAAKDGARPLSRADEEPKNGARPPPPPEDDEPIELQDEDVITLPPTTLHVPVSQLPPVPQPRRRRRRWPLVMAVLLLAAAGYAANDYLAGGVVFQTLSPWTQRWLGGGADAGTADELEIHPIGVVTIVPFVAKDAGEEPDAGTAEDAGAALDAGESVDAGDPDAGAVQDAGSIAEAPTWPDGGAPEWLFPSDGGKATLPDGGRRAVVGFAKVHEPSPTIADDEAVFVMVETEPPGATLKVDRHVFGQTPISIRFKIGIAFELALSKEGFEDVKVLHLVQRRNGQRVRVVLEPLRP